MCNFNKFSTPESSVVFQNPQAVNTELDVFTANRRDIRILESDIPSASGLTVPVGIVAIGAMLVGSVNWTDTSPGIKVAKGDDIGWFQYGGSTVIAVFPGDRIKWDDDLVAASERGTEVLVHMGEKIGQAIGVSA
jgi:phosphatidylserine decarboxylase